MYTLIEAGKTKFRNGLSEVRMRRTNEMLFMMWVRETGVIAGALWEMVVA